MIPVEYIGYFASVCIVLSFLMKKIHHIRLINLIGCLCFVIYGFLYDPSYGLSSFLMPLSVQYKYTTLVKVKAKREKVKPRNTWNTMLARVTYLLPSIQQL